MEPGYFPVWEYSVHIGRNTETVIITYQKYIFLFCRRKKHINLYADSDISAIFQYLPIISTRYIRQALLIFD